MDEVRALAAQGVREVTLLGQNVNAYAGRWPTARRAISRRSFTTSPSSTGIERIRFTTSHPLEFDDSLIEAYANVPKLAEPSAPAGAERLRPHSRAR